MGRRFASQPTMTNNRQAYENGAGPFFLVFSMNPFSMLWLFSLAEIPLSPFFLFPLHLFLDTELDMRPDH
jgi:hypothetical protein